MSHPMTDDKTRELLPCPFCDGEARLREGMGEYWVVCIACSATSCMRLSRGAAAREWNTRQAAKELYAPREVELERRNAELCKMLREITETARQHSEWMIGSVVARSEAITAKERNTKAMDIGESE